MLPALARAVSSISVRTINMRGGVLDYSKHKEIGLHVIAIGGLALSRGLTLEVLRFPTSSGMLLRPIPLCRWPAGSDIGLAMRTSAGCISLTGRQIIMSSSLAQLKSCVLKSREWN